MNLGILKSNELLHECLATLRGGASHDQGERNRPNADSGRHRYRDSFSYVRDRWHYRGYKRDAVLHISWTYDKANDSVDRRGSKSTQTQRGSARFNSNYLVSVASLLAIWHHGNSGVYQFIAVILPLCACANDKSSLIRVLYCQLHLTNGRRDEGVERNGYNKPALTPALGRVLGWNRKFNYCD